MKDTFLSEFADGLRTELGSRAKREPSWLLDFVEQHVPTDHGRYTLERHAPLREIVQLIEKIAIRRETESRVDVVKAEQIGFTTFALGLALWLVAEHGYNVGYFLPDDKMASEFGIARLTPIVTESSYLSTLMADAAVDRGVLKQLGEKFLYLLGLSKLKGATSRPMDAQLSDEVDLTSEAIRKWKRGRMSASKLRLEVDFSAPYRQDSGIDARFKEGSMRKWLIRCGACGKDEIVLEEIPDLRECFRLFGSQWVRVCPSCHRKLDLSAGRWVAAQPDREKDRRYSYRLSAMAFDAIDANFIMKDFLDAESDPEKIAIFDRTRRGIPNAGALQPFTDAKLLEMERDYVLQCRPTGNPIFVGGDVGNACWFWAEEWLPEGRARLVWAEKIHSDRYVARVTELIKILKPRFGVIDKMPLFTDSRKIAYAFPQTVALQQFDNGKEPELIEERVVIEGTVGSARRETGPSYLCVKGDRNLILGQFAAEATDVTRGLLIPRKRSDEPAVMHHVREHLKKLQKQAERDRRGNEVHSFLEGVPNHLGMAAASARLARLFAADDRRYVARAIARRTTVGDAILPRPDGRRRDWGLMRRG